MEIPTLEQIKVAIEAKGYDNLFAVESSLPKNTISGEIPLDFLYRIVNDKAVLAIVQRVFKTYKFNPDAIPDALHNVKVIKAMLEEIDKNNLIQSPASNESRSYVPGFGLSKLLFIGIRSKDFGGDFDDLLVVTNESGSIFEVFQVHTDLDFRHVLSPIRNSASPVCIKPGFYMDLFSFSLGSDTKVNAVSQVTELDLFNIEREGEDKYKYKQAIRGNFNLSIGCDDTGSSDKDLVKGMYCAEMKYQADKRRFLDAVDKYTQEQALTQHVHNIDGLNVLVIGDMTKFPFLLLEEGDIF